MTKIRKIFVSTGIFWVEIPEVDLRILCGCPEDTVKHLMQRGLILSNERDGISFETGPNAILLSDTMLQNSAFANLAEFPVLQMLYRQGMIIPGHPNNDGQRPLLIGSPSQIQAQMDYIYRGNYGLVSKEEICATGIDDQLADELFQMKLAFAFGQLRKSEDLLDSVSVEKDQWTQIRNGVEIRRLELSQFEIRYDGETVTVDLNLAKNQRYRSPYPLGFQDIKREYFSVIHSGQGDGWDINRPSMGSILTYQGKVYLVDTGPNVLYSLMVLGIGTNEIEGIFHTHCHDDHFAGLTTLMRTDHRIKHFATPLVRATIFKKLSALLGYDGKDFSEYFDIHDLRLDEWNNIDGLEIKPILSPHPVETTILYFRTFWDGHYKTYAHLADITSFEVMEKMITDHPDKAGIRQDFYDRTKAVYLDKVDLKKVDVGGGMIHGVATDFKHDRSDRIILCHNSAPLNNTEKTIGSSAPFGIVDVMIPSYTDNQRIIAEKDLTNYFPDISSHQLFKLLNNPITIFKPGSVIFKEGVRNNVIYLLITGIVEAIGEKTNWGSILPTGSMIGEYSGLHEFPVDVTYRTISYVHALAFPAKTYLKFIQENRLYSKIQSLQDNRQFLRNTWLFGESIGPQLQNLLSQYMELKNYYSQKPKVLTNINTDKLYIVKNGCVERMINDNPVKVINAGEFFSEEGVLKKTSGNFTYRTTQPSEIYEIPAEILRGIPVVLWKLFETYKETTAATSF